MEMCVFVLNLYREILLPYYVCNTLTIFDVSTKLKVRFSSWITITLHHNLTLMRHKQKPLIKYSF